MNTNFSVRKSRKNHEIEQLASEAAHLEEKKGEEPENHFDGILEIENDS